MFQRHNQKPGVPQSRYCAKRESRTQKSNALPVVLCSVFCLWGFGGSGRSRLVAARCSSVIPTQRCHLCAGHLARGLEGTEGGVPHRRLVPGVSANYDAICFLVTEHNTATPWGRGAMDQRTCGALALPAPARPRWRVSRAPALVGGCSYRRDGVTSTKSTGLRAPLGPAHVAARCRYAGASREFTRPASMPLAPAPPQSAPAAGA